MGRLGHRPSYQLHPNSMTTITLSPWGVTKKYAMDLSNLLYTIDLNISAPAVM